MQQIISPNSVDDLNLFRACVQASTQTLFQLSSAPLDVHPMRLREITAKCLRFSLGLCEAEFKAYTSAFLAARNSDELILACRNLPQLNFEVMQTLISHKKQLDAVRYFESSLEDYSFEPSTDISRANVLSVINSLQAIQSATFNDIRLDIYDHTGTDLTNLGVTDIELYINGRRQEIDLQIDTCINDCRTKLNNLEKVRSDLEKERELASQSLSQGQSSINSSYNEVRHRTHKALRKAGCLAALSCCGLYFFSAPLQAFFAKSLGAISAGGITSTTVATSSATVTQTAASLKIATTIASQATVLTISKHIVYNGKFRRLPEEFLKCCAVSAAGHVTTTTITGGYSIHKLPTTHFAAAGVTAVQRSLECMTHAILNNDNILKEGLIAALATGIVYTTAGNLIFSDSKLHKFMLSAGSKGLTVKLRGGESFEVTQAILLQAIDEFIYELADSLNPATKDRKRVATLRSKEYEQTLFPGIGGPSFAAKDGLFPGGQMWPEGAETEVVEAAAPRGAAVTIASRDYDVSGPLIHVSPLAHMNRRSVLVGLERPEAEINSRAWVEESVKEFMSNPENRDISGSRTATENRQGFWQEFSSMADDQQTDFYDRRSNYVLESEIIDNRIFKPIRSGKAAVVRYFEQDVERRERSARERGVSPDITSMAYAGPNMARAALSLVPETLGEFSVDVVGYFGVKPLMFVGSKALKYGPTTYFKGVMGTAHDRVAFRVTEALRSRSVVSEFSQGANRIYSATGSETFGGPIVRQFNELAGYAQGNKANLAKNNLLFSKSAKMDFAPTGFTDAQLYPAEKIPVLGEYLRKRGVDLYPVEYLPPGSRYPAFTASYTETGRPTVFLPRDATVLEVKHELSHYLDFKNLGIDKYSKLTRLEKEQMVLDRLKDNRIWKQLTDKEVAHSEKYVESLKPQNILKNKKGVKNVE